MSGASSEGEEEDVSRHQCISQEASHQRQKLAVGLCAAAATSTTSESVHSTKVAAIAQIPPTRHQVMSLDIKEKPDLDHGLVCLFFRGTR